MTKDTSYEHSGRRAEAGIEIAGDAKRVWEAWADPEGVASWFVDRAEGTIGRDDQVKWIWEDFGLEVPMRVEVAEPGRRFVLSGEWGDGTPTVLEVVIDGLDGGRSRVSLVQSGFAEGAEWDDEYEGTASGWIVALAVLKEYVEHHWGRPATVVFALRPVDASKADVVEAFTTEIGLASWLTTSGGVGGVGDDVALELQGGGRLTGRVLARTETEIALSWTERGAVLELWHFVGDGAQRMAGVRAFVWGDDLDEDTLRAQFDAAVERLVGALA